MASMSLRCAVSSLVISVLFLGCSDDECNLDQQTRDLARAGLTDCGFAEGQNVQAAELCARNANQMGQLFRVIRETSDGLEAFVRGDGGDYFLVRQQGEGDPIEQASCAGASEVTDSDGTRIECDEPGAFETVCK